MLNDVTKLFDLNTGQLETTNGTLNARINFYFYDTLFELIKQQQAICIQKFSHLLRTLHAAITFPRDSIKPPLFSGIFTVLYVIRATKSICIFLCRVVGRRRIKYFRSEILYFKWLQSIVCLVTPRGFKFLGAAS